MWSPRRFHSAVHFKGYLWIMGGRAREFVDLPHEQSIGGIIGPRVQDISLEYNLQQKFSTQREISYLKNDVWKSADGEKWSLVTPGCRVDKASQGTQRYACVTANDCYGAENCDLSRGPNHGTCVCDNMWGPREQHAIAVTEEYMYISGGFGAQLYPQFSNCGRYACGDIDATSYRKYFNDIWRSKDGVKWDPITEAAWKLPSPNILMEFPRGGHSMLAFNDLKGIPYLWIFGGEGGPNRPQEVSQPITYYNDIWRSRLTGNTPAIWEKVVLRDLNGNNQSSMPWAPRTGHGMALELGTTDNRFTRTLYLYGGQNNGTALNDFWAWRIDDPNEYWREDFTIYEYYGIGMTAFFLSFFLVLQSWAGIMGMVDLSISLSVICV
jgi:hypothetical protein